MLISSIQVARVLLPRLRVILLVASIAANSGMAQPSESRAGSVLEQKLAGMLRWEIIWDVSTSVRFEEPPLDHVPIALYQSHNSVAFCSLALGRCAYYYHWRGVIDGRPLRVMPCVRQRGPCSNKGGELGAVAEYVASVHGIVRDRIEQMNPVIGQGYSGLPGSNEEWITPVQLAIGSRNKIVSDYLKSRPSSFSSLRTWLSDRLSRNFRSISIPHFSDSDPHLYVWGTRSDGQKVLLLLGKDLAGGWELKAQTNEAQMSRFSSMVIGQIETMLMTRIQFAK